MRRAIESDLKVAITIASEPSDEVILLCAKH